VRFGPFHHRTKIDAKWTELVQLVHKLVQQSRLGFFSQRTLLIHPIGPKTPVLERFGPFRHRTKIHLKRAELVQLVRKLVRRSRLGFFRNEHNRSTPIGP
jgi:hypothetical protein